MNQLKTTSELVPWAHLDGDTLVLRLRGELDMRDSPALRRQVLHLIQTNHPANLVFNLQQVPFMDSSAVAVLVETLQTMRKTGGRVWLTNLQPRVKSLIDIAQLQHIFSIVDDEAQAVQPQPVPETH